ncbi:hypothetical protein LCGC14_0368760 [marine sediment metagenome]|uniref:Metallo-beta-lactamase domain-containing protein n=1 Tax=marine sediment metagenome TaxID=412755 RepID=A0A0F9TBM2_9ZZZZ|nr:MBL fold metallo-hydrolase [Phycisphaerae bacterium]HDZ44207.1 MBL fold metallo-hydrolase [Phycisphaerae bacterium]
MTVEYRIISIGALSHHRLWGEGGSVRTAHATTTLVSDGDRRILVDPSLPAVALAARFNERTGKTLADVTDVFCTTLRPVHRRSIDALPHAAWWASEAELDAYTRRLEEIAQTADRLGDDSESVAAELALVRRFRPAPETFAPQIHFYPLTGPSPGSAGLLLTPATQTVLIAGDAALTREHVQAGQIWQGCADTAAAMEAFTDMLEVADVIVCGHDNLMMLGRKWL